MAQRNSDYERRPRDLYETPAWVTRVLIRHLAAVDRVPPGCTIWEPAAGTGKMVDELVRAGYDVWATDIAPDIAIGATGDFLAHALPTDRSIVTNPPYAQAAAFIRRALDVTERSRGFVAMLLKLDFDSGRSRTDLFRDCSAWGTKIVLLDRITWFEPPPRAPGEKKRSGPSENHAWFVWDWQRPRDASPQIRYARNDTAKPAAPRATRQEVTA